MEIIKFLVSLFGFFLIYTACDLNRKEDSKIKMYSREWFLTIALVIAGIALNQIIYR